MWVSVVLLVITSLHPCKQLAVFVANNSFTFYLTLIFVCVYLSTIYWLYLSKSKYPKYFTNFLSHRLHVWYIYLHFPYRFIVHVGKYATHWLFGFPLFTYCRFLGRFLTCQPFMFALHGSSSPVLNMYLAQYKVIHMPSRWLGFSLIFSHGIFLFFCMVVLGDDTRPEV